MNRKNKPLIVSHFTRYSGPLEHPNHNEHRVAIPLHITRIRSYRAHSHIYRVGLYYVVSCYGTVEHSDSVPPSIRFDYRVID